MRLTITVDVPDSELVSAAVAAVTAATGVDTVTAVLTPDRKRTGRGRVVPCPEVPAKTIREWAAGTGRWPGIPSTGALPHAVREDYGAHHGS